MREPGSPKRSGKTFRNRMIRLSERLHLKTAMQRLYRKAKFYGIPVSVPHVLKQLPHDPKAFTQGLHHDGDYLYESTGLYGASSLRVLHPLTGEILKNIPVDGVFAEGIAAIGDRLLQLTWKSGKVLVYRLPELAKIGALPYQGEGWGLTATGERFVMSNGSHVLCYRDTNFRRTGRLVVTSNRLALREMNDIAAAGKKIYANVLHEKCIFEICGKTGKVLRIIDCAQLEKSASTPGGENVLNGIAYEAVSDTFFVTGKNWKYLFQVRLDE